MTSQTLWKPKKTHENLLSRVSVLPTSLTWAPTDLTGIWFGCFEADNEVQKHPVTMLTRFDPGGFFPLHKHPGGEEILVLEGNFADETGVHTPGTYMLNPEGFIHRPYSEEGCLTFVKLRQHGGANRQQVRTNIFKGSWQVGVIPQIQVKLLYKQANFSETVWIERWETGTQLTNIIETGIKEIFVIKGSCRDELGHYPKGSWLRYPPNCPYNLSSETGCLLYVKTYPVVDNTTRFFVFEDFDDTDENNAWN